MNCRHITARARRRLLSAVVVVAGVVSPSVFFALSARGDGVTRGTSLRESVMQAIAGVARAPAVHYATASRRVAFTVDVTRDGDALGDGLVDGVQVDLLRVDGHVYVRSLNSVPPGLPAGNVVPQLVDHWVTGVPFYDSALRQFRTPQGVAKTLRRAVQSGATLFDGVCLGGRPALRASTHRGVLYVTSSAPHRVLRWIPGNNARSQTHDERPHSGRCQRSAARSGAGRVPAARDTGAPIGAPESAAVRFGASVVLRRSATGAGRDPMRGVTARAVHPRLIAHPAAALRPRSQEPAERTVGRELPAGGGELGALALTDYSVGETLQLYQDLLDDATQLTHAFDASVALSLSNSTTLICAVDECIATIEVTNTATSRHGAVSGQVALSGEGDFTADGAPIGTCVIPPTVMPVNSVTTVECAAPTPLLPEILAAAHQPVALLVKGTIFGIATASVDVQRSILALQKSQRHLQQTMVRAAEAAARLLTAHNGRRVGRITCRDAVRLGPRLPAGTNGWYVVYWSPPPPPDQIVRYVGISQNLVRRCRDHPKQRSKGLETLNLPPLRRQQARQVEEALISHFGPAPELASAGGTRGQLQNMRHEIDPDNAGYCQDLLNGQWILIVNSYTRYSVALFTRGKKCPLPR